METKMKLAIALMVVGSCIAGCGGNDSGGQESAPSAQADSVSRSTLAAGSAEIVAAQQDEQFTELLDQLSNDGWSDVAWDNATLLQPSQGQASAIEVPIYPASGRTNENEARAGLTIDGDVREVYAKLPPALTPDDSSPENDKGFPRATTISQWGCAPYACDYPIRLTWYWACVNPADYYYGYALTRQVRYGYTKCSPSSPNWYANMCGYAVACPGVQTSSRTYMQCVPSSRPTNTCR